MTALSYTEFRPKLLVREGRIYFVRIEHKTGTVELRCS